MKISAKNVVGFLSIALLGANFCFAQTSSHKSKTSSGYHLLKKIEIGGEGGWDYLFADADAHRLYVSHSTKVVVIDTETGTKRLCTESAEILKSGRE